MTNVQEKAKNHLGIEHILIANQVLKEVVVHTPLQKNERLSNEYGCRVYIKREDLQVIRSFKLRGAYYKVKSIEEEARQRGVVCASAGNHAQGVAYACAELGIEAKIFMPLPTPKQKVDQVEMFGKGSVEIILTGDTFDDSYEEAARCTEDEGRIFIHPFDDFDIIAGQATVAVEIMNDIDEPVDFVFASIGGGGLMAGMSTYVKNLSPLTRMIGVEPAGAASMRASFDNRSRTALTEIDKFVDGAAVKCPGQKTFDICFELVDEVVPVPEGKVCTAILDLYNKHAIIAEPAGALPVAALDLYRDEIRGKSVVVVISGGNNDISRMQEIKEKSLIHQGLLYYFIVNFPQRAGALRQFLDNVLGPDDDITTFEYTKKNNKENGPALVGIELNNPGDFSGLVQRMQENGFPFTEVKHDSMLFDLLI